MIGKLWGIFAAAAVAHRRTFTIEIKHMSRDQAVFWTRRKLRSGDRLQLLLGAGFERTGTITFGRNDQYSCQLDLPFRRDDWPGGLTGMTNARVIS